MGLIVAVPFTFSLYFYLPIFTHYCATNYSNIANASTQVCGIYSIQQ